MNAELEYASGFEPAAPLFQVRLDGLRVFLVAALSALMPLSRVLETGGGKQVNFSLADPILPLGVFFLMWRLLTRGVRLPMITVCCLSLGSMVISSLLNTQLTMSARSVSSIVIELAKGLSLWLYFYAVVNVIDERKDYLLFLKAWIFAGAGVSLSGIIGSLAYQMTGVENAFALMFRAQGTFEDSNLFATHLSVSLFFTLLYRKLSGKRSIWTSLAIAIYLAGLFFSASRGGMLSVSLAFLAFWLLNGSMRSKAIGATVVLCAVLVVAAIPQAERQRLLDSNPITERLSTTTVDLNDPEAQQRRGQWTLALTEFTKSPLFGMGRGNYGLNFDEHEIGTRAHNTALELLAEQGTVGFAILAAFIGYFTWTLSRELVKSGMKEWFRPTSLLLVALLVIGLDGITISIENYRGLWMTPALMEVYRRLYLSPERSSRKDEHAALA